MYEEIDLGFPPGIPVHLKPGRIEDTETYKVLYAWHANCGLSMTPHLLCYIMQRPWADVRGELLRTYEEGKFFRTIKCPDINDIAYYVDYPVDMTKFDKSYAVHKFPDFMEFSDRKMEDYPPEKGYINSWSGKGLKELKFRERAYYKFQYVQSAENDQKIISLLRAACHVK